MRRRRRIRRKEKRENKEEEKRENEEEEEKRENEEKKKKTVNANLKLNCKSATPLYAAIYLKKSTWKWDATNDLYSSFLLKKI